LVPKNAHKPPNFKRLLVPKRAHLHWAQDQGAPGFNVVLGDIHLLSLTGGNDYYKSVKLNWPGYPR